MAEQHLIPGMTVANGIYKLLGQITSKGREKQFSKNYFCYTVLYTVLHKRKLAAVTQTGLVYNSNHRRAGIFSIQGGELSMGNRKIYLMRVVGKPALI